MHHHVQEEKEEDGEEAMEEQREEKRRGKVDGLGGEARGFWGMLALSLKLLSLQCRILRTEAPHVTQRAARPAALRLSQNLSLKHQGESFRIPIAGT